MSILCKAHDIVITGGKFIGQQNYHININRSGINMLLVASAPEAAVDAVECDYAPSCFPGTREQYIQDITNRATSNNTNEQPPIYWMNGPAGVGKYAIAQTSALKVKDAGYLGAAFFFSINGRQSDHTRLFPSLAYQLSAVLLGYCSIVNKRVLTDPTVFQKTIKAQFEFLIVEPIQHLKELGKEVSRRTIYIDGLDKCKNKDAQADIITIIALSVQAQSTPFQWVIFS
ncbi:hypothetical protein NP233_g7003 [Leucocoprinus birnbaumii]|uniref:Nephrocystin 3-like N-terminal domain-containing protein n=1 Tax=Leucocoprinus birnbaumii TaxID=56174 RepID=A0AAD5VQ73_9AGAR|nr:hypothetical protein NP233_g7003 [Leucocoprinus birnbaumii]